MSETKQNKNTTKKQETTKTTPKKKTWTQNPDLSNSLHKPGSNKYEMLDLKAILHDNWYLFATELPVKLRSVAHFYTIVVKTNHSYATPLMDSVFVYLLSS